MHFSPLGQPPGDAPFIVLSREADLISGLTSGEKTELTELLRTLLDDLQARLDDDQQATQVGSS